MQEFVNVPVPKERVLEVYALLGQGKRSASATLGELAEEWTEKMVARAIRESPAGMRAVFQYLSSHPDQDITMEELAKGIKRERSQMPGILGAFGRRCRYRYRVSTWPFESKAGRGMGMKVVTMPGKVAERVRMELDADGQAQSCTPGS